MIVTKKDFQKLLNKVAMVDGCFDPLHVGHVEYFKQAKKLGLPLFCNMRSDQYIRNTKKRNTILPEKQRANLIDSLKYIDYVYICDTSTADTLSSLIPRFYVKGDDWKKRALPEEEQKICHTNNIKIKYLDTVLDSSTNIVKKFLDCSASASEDKIADFEKFVLGQKEFDSKYYDDKYLSGQWKDGANSYSIENRRRLEGKNPENIKKVFKPKKVLDYGCGPGALMLFLDELGVDVYGLDFSQAAKDEAPSKVANRIFIGSVEDQNDIMTDFDLVICRETLEHLTVLQLVKTVQNLAKITNKYLYITTRFHPNPQSLLDVTDQPEVDPSHITLLNKDFLRTLFVLEGLKSRRDLEKKLDWKNYGRVLVFEKVNKGC